MKRPTISDDDRKAFRLWWDLQEKYRDELRAATMKEFEKIPAFAPILKSMTPAQLEAQEKASRDKQRKALIDDQWDDYVQDAQVQGAMYARMGVEFEAWFELLRVYRVAAVPLMAKEYGNDTAKLTQTVIGMDRFIDIAMALIGAAYLSAKQDIISSQSKAIRELSTPVLTVRPRLLIAPLVGMIDTERARQVTEHLLHAIRQKRARAVVLDITGVPVVDSKVANHLMQTVDAAGLMGAKVIVSGMSPEIAQTLVTLGAELPGVHTVGDLEEALVEAERSVQGPAQQDVQ